MASYRCSDCGIGWPVSMNGRCAICGQTTSYIGNDTPLPLTEAKSLKAHADFERWLNEETPQARTSRHARYQRELKRRAEETAALEKQLELDGPER